MRSPELIAQVFAPIYGEPCWNVQCGYGSFLTLEFGLPHLVMREPRDPKPTWSAKMRKLQARRLVTVRGDWHLWIYCCRWRVCTGEKLIGHSALESSSKRPIQRAARELDGQRLLSVTLEPSGGDSVFTFDLGSRLETSPYNEGSDQWLLYEPSGKVLVYRADGRYSHQPGDTPPHGEEWQPLS